MQLEGKHGAIRHFLMDCEIKSRTSPTLQSYEHHLRVLSSLLQEVCEVTELEQVTVIHLRQCVQYLLTKPVRSASLRPNDTVLSTNSVRGHVRVWKAFFTWCFREELIDVNPTVRLTPPKPEKRIKPTLSPEHIEKMLNSCDLSTDMGFRDYVILLLLFDTGIRLAEICALKVRDVQDTYIKVYGKGRREREVGIHPEVSKLLWKYIHKHRFPQKEGEVYLFVGRRGPLHKTGLQEILERIQRASGLGDVHISPHVFRHTFAKMYLERGGDLFSLSREMGHSDVSITKIYLEDFSSSQARKEHTTYSPVGSINLKKSRMGTKRKK